MHAAPAFLANLALVLGVAALTTVLFQRLRQPVVLGYILAGLLTGPNTAFPLFADRAVVETLSELGVILVMFSLGLEFSLRRLLRLGAAVALVAVIEVSLMMWLGFSVARLAGWSGPERLLTAAAVAISSTTIIAKAFEENRVEGRLRDLVFGVLVVEDLLSILLLAALPPLLVGRGGSWIGLGITAARLGAFLAGALAVGMLLVPRLVRLVVKMGRSETILVVSIGLCFTLAVIGHAFGYSVALGAFLAGTLVAESGEASKVEILVHPVRDMFAAIFFVSIGMLIEPHLLLQHWTIILVLTAVVVLGKLFSVSLAAFLGGRGTRTALRAGMSMAQIGELSFVLIGMGVSLKVVSPFLFPVVVAVSVVTTTVTPFLIRFSDPIAAAIDRALPDPVQTFASLYGTWLERLGSRPQARTHGARLRRLARFVVIDGILLAGIVIGAALGGDRLVPFLAERLSLSDAVARALVIAAACLLALPLLLGLVRVARALGLLLALMALPEAEANKVDLAAAPRRALIVTLQLAVLLAVGAPLVAVTQPFLPAFQGLAVFLTAIVVFGVAFWRSATNLQGHVRAGAQVIVEMLASQSRSADRKLTPLEVPVGGPDMLPGLGAPVSLRIEPGAVAVGKTLAALNLRGLTGATVLAVRHAEGLVAVPTGHEILKEGDVLALAGTREAVELARSLLVGG